MWFLIKFMVGLFVFIVLVNWFMVFSDHYNRCDDRGGRYNLTTSGFECQGAKEQK